MTIDKAQLRALAEAASKEREANRQMALKGVFFPSGVSISAMRLHSGPEVILALLAEIDQLKASLDMESAELAWSDSDGREIQAERDKLRAELAGLRTGYDAQNEVIAELRKDAERYNWAICRVQCAEALSAVVICHDGYKEKINERVDAYMEAWPCPVAAMAKEASHG